MWQAAKKTTLIVNEVMPKTDADFVNPLLDLIFFASVLMAEIRQLTTAAETHGERLEHERAKEFRGRQQIAKRPIRCGKP